MANGNGVTLGPNSRISVGLLVTLIGLVLVAASGWVSMAVQANSALSREAAYQTFVAKSDYTQDQSDLCARLTRIEDKLDRLVEKR